MSQPSRTARDTGCYASQLRKSRWQSQIARRLLVCQDDFYLFQLLGGCHCLSEFNSPWQRIFRAIRERPFSGKVSDALLPVAGDFQACVNLRPLESSADDENVIFSIFHEQNSRWLSHW